MTLYKPFALQVVDGDTLNCILRCDPFNELLVERRLRLYGIDTPEKNTEAGRSVMKWVTRWMELNYNYLQIEFIEPDKFAGRFVGKVWCVSGSKKSQFDLSNLLLQNYLAKSFTGKIAKSPWTDLELQVAEKAASTTPVRVSDIPVLFEPLEDVEPWVTPTPRELESCTVTTVFHATLDKIIAAKVDL